ncbi:hypothetical protein PoB_002365100 [Plakobranchus ocellatus]|uniref:Uncharacterized protein n=1 Tax=Plakobranchus ocellatus TaxID=259542 RepID=A0AAV3ZD06_9GAST|nr:hypothetical protein PoB_002365100 [Plakobranchus ocellatus]
MKAFKRDLSKIIQCLASTNVPVSTDSKPAPAPLRVKGLCPQTLAEQPVPWWEQPRHQTVHDYIFSKSRIQAARLSNQPQYFMGP